MIAVTHTTGCGMSADGEGLALLRRTLAGYARHPNVGAVALVGLGCEVNQISSLTDDLGLEDRLVIQELGGSVATVRRGIDQVRELLPAAAATARRTPAPLSALTLGLQCGGSDAWSGVSANPVLGVAVDRLVGARRHGGAGRDAGDPRCRAPADRVAPPRRRSRGRCSSGSRGGSAMPPPRAATWTTTPRPATAPGASRRSRRSRSARSRRAARHRCAPSTGTPSRSPSTAWCSWTRPAMTRCR